MDMAIQEMPLAIFTTLAPIGAGAFIALAIAFFTGKYSNNQLKEIDKFTVIPLILIAVGFAASFFHLASPGKAFGVLAGLGSSPLSNEIAVGVVFTLAALLYWILALAGKLNEGARKGFVAVVAVLAVVFACFTGLAYYVDTIPSWSTPAAPISIIGFALAGGAVLGALVLALAGASEGEGVESAKKPLMILLVVGAVLGLAGACMQFGAASGIMTAAANGAQLASAVAGYLGGFVVIFLAGAAIGAYALLKKMNVAMTACAAIVVVIGVFLARLVFYALEISIGL